MRISYSAPAKAIISGEHAVVYGKLALVTTLHMRLQFSVWEGTIEIKDPNILRIDAIVKKYLKEKRINFTNKPFSFAIESTIPVGRGLGSSAALSVTAVAALLTFYTARAFSKKIINDLAFEVEKYFHQNPSGVDNTASCFGGLLSYRKNMELDFLDFPQPLKIQENLLLIDSGKPEEKTAEMVNLVKKMSDQNPFYLQQILEEIESTTFLFKTALAEDNLDLFKTGIEKNEMLLEKIGVVSKETKKLLTHLFKFGVGKITGAGGSKGNSGFILFLTTGEDKEQLTAYLKKQKINFYKFTPDNKGLIKL